MERGRKVVAVSSPLGAVHDAGRTQSSSVPQHPPHYHHQVDACRPQHASVSLVDASQLDASGCAGASLPFFFTLSSLPPLSLYSPRSLRRRHTLNRPTLTFSRRQYEVTVLKIHLSSSQLAWFAVPILLLSLLAPLAFFLAVHPFSAVDLTDPLDTALIALSSPASSNVKAFAKGQNRKSTRIRLGEPNEGPHRPTSMVFKAAGEKSGLGGLEKPRRMSTVV